MNRLLISFALVLSAAASSVAGGIYWSDRFAGASAIRGCNFDKSGVRDILRPVTDPRGIAVDAANDRLYYCDRMAGTSTSGVINFVAISGLFGVQPTLITLNRPADLRFDPATRMAYWCEENAGLVRRVLFPSAGGVIPAGNVQNLYSGIGSPYYLDIDVAGGRLYCGTNGTSIFNAPLAGGSIPPAIYTLGLNVRGVCVDAARGQLYWCERDGAHVIRRMPVGGGTAQNIYTDLDTPHGLVLDLAARKMYWADTGTNGGSGFNARGISRGDMDGATLPEVVVAGTASTQPWDVDLDRRNTTYMEWRARFFRYDAAATITNPDADPDADGLLNAAEYSLGTAPLVPNGAVTTAMTVNDASTDYPAIQFRRRAGTSDLTVVVQVSTDLATWRDNSTGAYTTELGATAQEDGMELVTARSNAPLDAARQFLRVKMTVP